MEIEWEKNRGWQTAEKCGIVIDSASLQNDSREK